MVRFVRNSALIGGIGILLGPALYRVFDGSLLLSLGTLFLGAMAVSLSGIRHLEQSCLDVARHLTGRRCSHLVLVFVWGHCLRTSLSAR